MCDEWPTCSVMGDGNGGHGHNSFSQLLCLKDNTCLNIFYMDIASMLFIDAKITPPPDHLVKGKESPSACAWRS